MFDRKCNYGVTKNLTFNPINKEEFREERFISDFKHWIMDI